MLWFDELPKMMLGAFRVGGLLVAMPVFGTSPLPPMLKFFLAFAFSAALLPFQPAFPPELWGRSDLVLVLAVREIFLGLLMGYGVRFIFLMVTMALEFAGLQMGFSIANVFDPQNNSQVSVIAQLGATLSIMFFFAANLHHEVFLTLVRSYEVIPIGVPDWNFGLNIERLVSFLGMSFSVALRLSMPVMAVMLILHFVMGIMGKAAPQMNLFFNVAFIINVATGILLVALLIPTLFPEITRQTRAMSLQGYGLW